MAGERVKAQEIREELEARARRSYVSPVDLAVASTGLGDRNAAFGWLERRFGNARCGFRNCRSPSSTICGLTHDSIICSVVLGSSRLH